MGGVGRWRRRRRRRDSGYSNPAESASYIPSLADCLAFFLSALLFSSSNELSVCVIFLSPFFSSTSSSSASGLSFLSPFFFYTANLLLPRQLLRLVAHALHTHTHTDTLRHGETHVTLYGSTSILSFFSTSQVAALYSIVYPPPATRERYIHTHRHTHQREKKKLLNAPFYSG